MKEIWKDINGYKYRYQISNLGRLRNLNPFHKSKLKEVTLGALDAKGYLRTELTKQDGTKISKKIHRLVAEYFLEEYNESLTVNHKDFDKTNNKVSNLEMSTVEENILHYIENVKKLKTTSKNLYVRYREQSGKWIVVVKRKQLGSFDSEEEATKYRDNYFSSIESQIDQVARFHKAFKIKDPNTPTNLSPEEVSLRCKLLYEELEEYEEAAMQGNMVETLDALGDQLYIILGTILRHGMQNIIVEVFNEIQRSNMSKLNENGEPIINGVNGSDPTKPMGKILKSEQYTPPNLKPILERWVKNLEGIN